MTDLVSAGLFGVICGLIDRDNENKPSKGVSVLKRYSIENYLLDPLVIYCAGVERDPEWSINKSHQNLARGEEYRLRTQSVADLQSICSAVLDPIERELRDVGERLSGRTFDVTFSNGITLQYPLWLKDLKGKNILNAARSAHKGFVDVKALLRAFERLQLVPEDLSAVYRELIGTAE